MAKASDNSFPSVLLVEGSTPATPASGKQRLFVDSTGALKLVDDAGVVAGVGGAVPTAWADYTPTWTGASSNPSLGSGGVIKGRYRRFGYNVEGRIELVQGSGGSAGSGIYYFSLPPSCTPATPITGVSYAVGAGWIYSGSTITTANLAIENGSPPVKFRVIHAGSTGNVWNASSLPLTGSDNLVTFTFSYETTTSAFG